jgi:predicted ATPase
MAAAHRQPEAMRTIERALTECEQTSQGWCDAELWRVRGELLLRNALPDRAAATQSFERALGIARTRGARLWELRASLSLARLWVDQGDRSRAVALLQPIYDWFTEGFDTVDLVEARALLSELGWQGEGADIGRIGTLR